MSGLPATGARRRALPGGAAVALLRRARVQWPLLALVTAVVALVALVVAVLPRHLEQAGRDALTRTLAAAPASARGVVGTSVEVLPAPGGDAMAGLRRVAATAQESLPPALASRLGPPASLVDSIRYALVPLAGADPLPLPTYLTLRAHDGIEEHLSLVAGRMPQPVTETRPLGGDTRGRSATVVEVLLTPRTAEEVGIAVGDEILGHPDAGDALVRRRSFAGHLPLVVRVVGLAELSDPDDDFWFGDARLHRPARQDTGAGADLFPFAILTPESLRSLPDVAARQQLRLESRAVLATTDLAPDDVRELRDVVRRLEAGAAADTAVTWRSGLGALLDGHLAAVAGARAASLLALAGVLAVAVIVVALVGILLAVRRRDATALVRGRGAGAGQLLSAQAVEAVLLTVPAGALAVVAARTLVPGATGRDGAVLAGAVALLAAVALVGAALPDARRPLRSLVDRDTDRHPGTSLRRRTLEAAAVVVTVIALVALRRRGVAIGDAAGLDPLLLLAPLLLASAVALITVRLHRAPLRAAGHGARRGRGAAALLGFARAGRTDRTGAPLAVLLVATTVSVVALSLDTSVRDGQVRSSWNAVGAPYRIDAPAGETLPPALLERLPADLERARSASATVLVSDSPGVSSRVELVMMELDRYARLTAGTPAHLDLPPELLAAPSPATGGAGPAVPGVASASTAGTAVAVGDTVPVLVGTRTVDVRIVAVRPRITALAAGDDAVVVLVPLDHVEAVLDRPVPAARLHLGSAGSGAADLAALAGGVGGTLLDRAAILAESRGSPLTAVVLLTLRVAAGLALAMAALALWISLAVSGRQRARDLALLLMLGGTRRQAAVAGLTEVLPAVLLAAAVGGGLGAVTVVLLRRPLDLGAFTGDATAALAVPGPTVLAVAGGIALGGSLLATAHAFAARRAHPRSVLEEADR